MYVRSIAMERAPPRDRRDEVWRAFRGAKAVWVCWGTNATAEATIVAKRIARKDFMVAVDLDNDDDLSVM
jgi:hypothetical protein